MQLGSGKCRLRIYDLKKGGISGLSFLKPIVVVISDIPESKMTIRSCTSHIATCVAEDFGLDPHRMMWLEYYPMVRYGENQEKMIPERLEVVEFEWQDRRAIKPAWRTVQSPMREKLMEMIESESR